MSEWIIKVKLSNRESAAAFVDAIGELVRAEIEAVAGEGPQCTIRDIKKRMVDMLVPATECDDMVKP